MLIWSGSVLGVRCGDGGQQQQLLQTACQALVGERGSVIAYTCLREVFPWRNILDHIPSCQ